MDDKLYFGMPVGSQDYEVTADECDQHHVIPTTSQGRWAMTELERFDLERSDVNGFQGDNCNNADVDEEDEALKPLMV
jgi:hypothetical protein